MARTLEHTPVAMTQFSPVLVLSKIIILCSCKNAPPPFQLQTSCLFLLRGESTHFLEGQRAIECREGLVPVLVDLVLQERAWHSVVDHHLGLGVSQRRLDCLHPQLDEPCHQERQTTQHHANHHTLERSDGDNNIIKIQLTIVMYAFKLNWGKIPFSLDLLFVYICIHTGL